LIGVLPSPPSWKGFSLTEAVCRYEGRIIERALKDAGGLVTHAARLLGYEHHYTLINKINKWHRYLLSTRSPIIQRRRSLMFVGEAKTQAHIITILHVEDNKLVADALKETLETE